VRDNGKESTVDVLREWLENNDKNLREQGVCVCGGQVWVWGELHGRFVYSRDKMAACLAVHQPHA
jgi:hypothetical protein